MSKSLRADLQPDDFSEYIPQEVIRELQEFDKGTIKELVHVTTLMTQLGIDAVDRVASQALIEDVQLQGRKRRLKKLATEVTQSVLTEEKINDLIEKISSV